MKKLVVSIAVFVSSLTILAQQSSKKRHGSLTVNGKTITIDLNEYEAFRDSIIKIHPDTLQIRFVKLLNKYRVSNSLNVLVVNSKNSKAADYISNLNLNLVYTQKLKLAHTVPTIGYETFDKRLAVFGLVKNFNASGECLLSTSIFFEYYYVKLNKISFEQAILNTWIQSPGHNIILLKPNAIQIGFSYKHHDVTDYRVDGIGAIVIN